MTGWTDAQGGEYEAEVPGSPSTFEVGTITPLACPQCTIEARLDLRIVTIDRRRHARATLVTHYNNERLRIQGARITFVRTRFMVGDVLTDRRGVATLSKALRLGSRVRATSASGWIQYDDDNRLSLPQAKSPWIWVRAR